MLFLLHLHLSPGQAARAAGDSGSAPGAAQAWLAAVLAVLDGVTLATQGKAGGAEVRPQGSGEAMAGSPEWRVGGWLTVGVNSTGYLSPRPATLRL